MESERRPLASVDDVRAELRRLGYFDSGLDRFVLQAASGAKPLRAAWRAAWRVGLTGGIVFGVALSLLAVSREPGVVTRPADLAWLAFYLAAPLAAVTLVGTLALGLLASALARRFGRGVGHRLPRLTALVLAGSGLAYLGLWWRSHGSGAPVLEQTVFVAIGVGVAFLLGRFGAIASVAVLSAGGLHDSLPEASLSRRHLLPVLVGGTLVFGGSLAMANYLEARADVPPDFAVVPTGVSVRVVGIDGLERRMAEQMLARGEMPHLAGLLRRGTRAALRPEPEQVPAIVWTTIATGRGPEAHGIRAAGTRRLPGMAAPMPLSETAWSTSLARAADVLRITRREPATALLRGAKTFWNVASEKGLRVGIVNWWASWPAETLNGFVVSDRAFLRIEKGGKLDRETFPEDALAPLRPIAAKVDGDRARRLDAFHVAALLELARGAPADLDSVYLNGLDIHTIQQLGQSAQDLADLDSRLEDVRAYHRFLDDRLGELSAGVGPLQMLVLVGDPGRFARRSQSDAAGLLVLAGGPARPGRTLPDASERDIAPTLLHVLGLPVSEQFAGHVLGAALSDAFRSEHPVRAVSSYGQRPRHGEHSSAFDRDVLEELRSLGYIR